MSALAATTPSSLYPYFLPVETFARTDWDFWQKTRPREAERKIQQFESDTSLQQFSKSFDDLLTVSTKETLSTVTNRENEKWLKKNLGTLFQTYLYEEFEEGMDNAFVEELELFIFNFGSETVKALSEIINESNMKRPQVVFEALRWLGSIDHTESHKSRLHLLEKSLSSPSRWIRDGAALGLATIKDMHSIPYLQAAVEKEPIAELREDMKAVLNKLKLLSNVKISS
jgi:hypothetical protein